MKSCNPLRHQTLVYVCVITHIRVITHTRVITYTHTFGTLAYEQNSTATSKQITRQSHFCQMHSIVQMHTNAMNTSQFFIQTNFYLVSSSFFCIPLVFFCIVYNLHHFFIAIHPPPLYVQKCNVAMCNCVLVLCLNTHISPAI